jgi:hypothetical protein
LKAGPKLCPLAGSPPKTPGEEYIALAGARDIDHRDVERGKLQNGDYIPGSVERVTYSSIPSSAATAATPSGIPIPRLTIVFGCSSSKGS